MRAHDHFVSQKMTDCSSPKEESLPIQNAMRGARLQNVRNWNQNGESQSDAATAGFLINPPDELCG
jgi:hypothetical protein